MGTKDGFINETLSVNADGRLMFAGADTVELAERFGTPLYCLSEEHIRRTAGGFRETLSEAYPDSLVCYASKAFSAKAIYKVIDSEGLGADVAGKGELFTAVSAGFDMSKVYFHGNNKLPAEIDYAVESGVHAIVIDCESEIELVSSAAERRGKTVGVLLRLNPSIEAATHKHIQTAKADSKFGLSTNSGAALNAVKEILRHKSLYFLGIHCHIGSQIFDRAPFENTVEVMTDFIVEIKEKAGVEVKELNAGGGYGIRYIAADAPEKPQLIARRIAETLVRCVQKKGITPPRLIIEPGRSMIGEAGITIYTAGVIKDIPGVRKYIGVDGGLFENPRYTMYGAKYTALSCAAPLSEKTEKATLVGKCCETDIIAEDVDLPAVKRGDKIAVLSTGAYNFSMASNYNRNPVPPVILVSDGEAECIVRPQTFEEIAARDVVPERLG